MLEELLVCHNALGDPVLHGCWWRNLVIIIEGLRNEKEGNKEQDLHCVFGMHAEEKKVIIMRSGFPKGFIMHTAHVQFIINNGC